MEELQVVRSERDRAVSSSKTLKQTLTGLQAERAQLVMQVCEHYEWLSFDIVFN